MTVTVKVDAQGRVVIPQAERERLGLPDGGALELVSTPEGVLLERDVRQPSRPARTECRSCHWMTAAG